MACFCFGNEPEYSIKELQTIIKSYINEHTQTRFEL